MCQAVLNALFYLIFPSLSLLFCRQKSSAKDNLFKMRFEPQNSESRGVMLLSSTLIECFYSFCYMIICLLIRSPFPYFK